MPERLLIVEDEETLSESLKRVFMREGYEVETAGSAEQALSIVKDRYFDLVIADIILPGLTGIDLLRKTREYTTKIRGMRLKRRGQGFISKISVYL